MQEIAGISHLLDALRRAGSQADIPRQLGSNLCTELSNGYYNKFSRTRVGFLASGIYHRDIQLYKIYEWIEGCSVFNVQLLDATHLKGFYITARELTALYC